MNNLERWKEGLGAIEAAHILASMPDISEFGCRDYCPLQKQGKCVIMRDDTDCFEALVNYFCKEVQE